MLIDYDIVQGNKKVNEIYDFENENEGLYQCILLHLFKIGSLSKSIRMSVRVYRRISLTAGLIWFSFTVKLSIGPGMVYSYFGEVISTLPRRKRY